MVLLFYQYENVENE